MSAVTPSRDPRPEEIAEALRCPDEYLHDGAPFMDDDPELFRTWALGPALMRGDAETTEQVAEGTDLFFFLREHPRFVRDWQGIRMERHGRWTDHVSWRVLNDDGTPSEIFRAILAWRDARD